jgi:transcriptional regulator with XRE-family HTH domain
MIYGERLKKYRLARDMTQEELSAQTGILATSISRIEHGTRKLALEEAVRIAEVLRIRVEALVSDDILEELSREYHEPLMVTLKEKLDTIPLEYRKTVADVLETLLTGHHAMVPA